MAILSGSDNSQKLDLLYPNIEGVLAGELRCHSDVIKGDSEKSLRVILATFAETSLLSCLLQIEQPPGESIREFSVRVRYAGERLMSRQRELKEP